MEVPRVKGENSLIRAKFLFFLHANPRQTAWNTLAGFKLTQTI